MKNEGKSIRPRFQKRIEAFIRELHGGTVPPQNDKEVITWTDDELDAFDKLVESQWSPDPTRRFETKTEMANFEKVHGHEKCSAMFWHLESMSKKPWEK